MARKRDEHSEGEKTARSPRAAGNGVQAAKTAGDKSAGGQRASAKGANDKTAKDKAQGSKAGGKTRTSRNAAIVPPTGNLQQSGDVRSLKDIGPVSRVGAVVDATPVIPAAADSPELARIGAAFLAPLAAAAAGPAPAETAANAVSAGADAAPSPSTDNASQPAAYRADDRTEQGERVAKAKPPEAKATEDPAKDQNPLIAAELPARLAENIERIENLGHRLLRAMAAKPVHAPAVEGPGPDLYNSVAQAWIKLAAEQPARLIEQQVRFWGDTLRHVVVAQDAFARTLSAPETDGPEDRRFKNPLWRRNPFYHFVMTQYQINAEAIRKAAADLDIPDEIDRRRIDWFTRQMIDMLAPTNFLATNPDALERAIETEGESLVRGLENLVRDIEVNGGDLVVSLSDRDAFKVGENIGTTPGEVVYRTPMLELIQFHPTTEKVHDTPILVLPPWINKYYIMDLKPQNSLLRWIVDQGFTLFVVSWKNPGREQADLAMDDYVASYLEVIGKVLELTGKPQLNAVGYCIAGTTLSATLALMKQRGDDRVKSATFFTTLTDFSDQGEFTTFLQDDFVGGIEDEVAHTGYLSAQLMQRTFSFLRANDLIWAPAIRSYMLGEPPPAFDLLYWNGDGTNLPGRMVTQYLRELCQKNALVNEGFEILGNRVHLSEVTVPLCAVACEGDHIAPWIHSWRGVAQMGSADKTFILSESGHIAGIINPPTKMKYGHYTSDAGFAGSADDWRAAGQFHPGSWWGRWGEWLAAHSGEMVPARSPAQSLAPAPGTYVLEKV